MSHNDSDEFGRDERMRGDDTAHKEAILKQILDPAARMRLNNIRMVKPDLAAIIENYLITAASQGKLGSRVSDEQLKQLLLSMQKPRRDFKINRL